MPQRGRGFAGCFRARGFTLVELLVTVAVIAIMAALAVPNFANLVRSSRLTSAANEMVAMLQIARTTAISSRANTTVCPSADGATCSATIGNRWIAVTTKNAVSTVVRDSTFPASIPVGASANLSGASYKFTFTPHGFSAVGVNASGVVGLCSPGLPGDNGIDVSAGVGRISTTRRAATSACTAPADN